MSKKIMFQGTASNVGKSTIVTGLGRIFKQDGYTVTPFKSQNMALNSFITKEGLEMGRAQVSQAEACGLEPIADMNPILLKPCGNNKSQVIVRGKVVGDMTSPQYHEYKLELMDVLRDIFKEFEENYDIVVMEGAGSAAEINLMERDISNMGMARIADAPVILVGDIDRGGVFASLAGTMLLLSEEDRKRVKGVIINKFRGRKELLDSGVKMLEEIINVPVLGVVPYCDIKIEDEDSVTTRFKKQMARNDIHIEIVRTPHMSNFTDFNIFETQEDVSIRYVDYGESLGNPDIVIIPGTKSTIDDLMFLRKNTHTKNEISLDEPLNVDWDGNELLLSDIIGTDEDIIYRDIETEVECKMLKKAINQLPERERIIVDLRFGLSSEDGEEKTQKEVADMLGISQSYISRLEKKIMRQLRKEMVKSC